MIKKLIVFCLTEPAKTKKFFLNLLSAANSSLKDPSSNLKKNTSTSIKKIDIN